MPIEEVLRAFAEENFGGSNYYYPVSHGQTKSIKPLAVVVKKQRSVFKRPFAKSELIVITTLDDYVVKDKKEEFTEAVNSTLLKEDNLEIVEDDAEDEGAKSSVNVRLEAGKCVNVNVKIANVFGELELGSLDQEYIKDPDLRELLDMAVLDVKRMESLEDQKLRLIYSVIYSEKFVLRGKREHELQADGAIEAPVPEVFEWLTKHAQVGAHYSKKIIPSKVAVRQSRSPVFFKLVRVDYDKDQGRLNLSKGELAGHEVISKSVERATVEKKENSQEYVESVVGSEKEETESLTVEDIKKLEIIKESVLKSAGSRKERKERVKKYLSWFEEALITDKQKLSLVEPLTVEDRKFLQSIFSPVHDPFTVDLSKSFDKEKIQGYAIVLKQIDDLSDEHWDEIEKAWA